jgi:hypothetical protein
MEENTSQSQEWLRTSNIGDVKVSLIRLNGSDPMRKSYQLCFLGEAAHFSFVKGSVMQALEQQGYDTSSQYDSESHVLSFKVQAIENTTMKPLAPASKPLGSKAIFTVMQELSGRFPSASELESAMQTERMSRQANGEGWAMKHAKQQAESLLPTSDISRALMGTLQEHLAPNGYIEETNTQSSIWKKAVHQAASDLQRLLIERLAEKPTLGR